MRKWTVSVFMFSMAFAVFSKEVLRSDEKITSLAWSQDGEYFLLGSKTRAGVYSSDTGKEVFSAEVDGEELFSASLDKSGFSSKTQLVLLPSSGDFCVWDLSSKKASFVFKNSGEHLSRMTFSAGGNFIAAEGRSGGKHKILLFLQLYFSKSFSKYELDEVDWPVSSFSFSPNNRFLTVVMENGDTSVYRLDDYYSKIFSFGGSAAGKSPSLPVLCSQDGEFVVYAGENPGGRTNAAVTIQSVANGTKVVSEVGDGIRSLVFPVVERDGEKKPSFWKDDGNRVFSVLTEKSSFLFFRLDSGELFGSVSVTDGGGVEKYAFSPDGGRILVLLKNGMVRIIELRRAIVYRTQSKNIARADKAILPAETETDAGSDIKKKSETKKYRKIERKKEEKKERSASKGFDMGKSAEGSGMEVSATAFYNAMWAPIISGGVADLTRMERNAGFAPLGGGLRASFRDLGLFAKRGGFTLGAYYTRILYTEDTYSFAMNVISGLLGWIYTLRPTESFCVDLGLGAGAMIAIQPTFSYDTGYVPETFNWVYPEAFASVGVTKYFGQHFTLDGQISFEFPIGLDEIFPHLLFDVGAGWRFR